VPDDRHLFRREGQSFVPTGYTRGPWRPDAMHGGPPSALVGLAIEEARLPGEQVARITIDLEKPVPLVALIPLVERRAVSRRISQLEIVLAADQGPVARARALLLRGSDEAAAGADPLEHLEPEGEPFSFAGDETAVSDGGVYHLDGVEFRMVQGGFAVPGPAGAWIRTAMPVVGGEAAVPLAQLLAVADYGSALSSSSDRGFALINVDVSVALHRAPVGEWFRLITEGHVGPEGIGLATSQLSDCAGILGTITQNQIVHSLR
jgi:Thioesterase-like superfamily